MSSDSPSCCKPCSSLVSIRESGQTRQGVSGWDIVILTASNEIQAANYRKQIEYRLLNGLLPKGTRYAVVADLHGTRIGSGGAVFNVLKYIRESSDEKDCFLGKHILLINSGGDSKRVPQYSACGKIFAPVARELSDYVSAALFDEIIKSVANLPLQLPDGILVASGDILLLFNLHPIEIERHGSAVFSVRAHINTGENHGVFTQDEQGNVKRFLHKFPVGDLRKAGAEDSSGKVHLDTGIVWLSSCVIKDLFSLISTGGKIDCNKFADFVNDNARLSFYADFLYPMARDSTLEQFYTEKPEGSYSNELKTCRMALWQVLHRYSMRLIDLSPALYIHIGTTAEFLNAMTRDITNYSCLGWKRRVHTNMVASGRFSVNTSFIDDTTDIGEGSYVEYSSIYHSKIGKNCIVSNITLDSKEIPDNTVIHCLKQLDGSFVVRVYSVFDNPKLAYKKATFLGKPILDFINRNNICIDDLWDEEPYSLWNAKLYYRGTLCESLEYALRLSGNSEKIYGTDHRVSLKTSYENADNNDIGIQPETQQEEI